MRWWIRGLSATLMVLLAGSAAAQTVLAPTERLTFDRPESWALQYFTSASMLSGLGPDTSEARGGIRLEIESGWVPPLSAAQQQVGFAGTAAEDLNKAPLLLRPRVRIGVTERLTLIAGGVPPVHAFGVTPKLIDLGAEWTMIDGAHWRAALRAHGQTGTVTGAFTCPAGVVSAAPGSAGNPTGCQTTSDDAATLRYGAVEFAIARRLAGTAVTPHASIALNAIDSHFQVDAHTFGRIDETALFTHGFTGSASAGASVPIGSRFVIVADMFYSPLMVQRTTTAPSALNGFLNVRALVSYRLR